MSPTKNDLAWKKILEEVTAIDQEIASKGFYEIESSQIKKYGNHEPRFACKIDYWQKIPKPLKDRELSILAVRKTRYRIAGTYPFIPIDEAQFERLEAPDTFAIPDHVQAISPHNITSESKALDAALASGMIKEVVGEKVGLVLRGREFCQPIDFSLPDRKNGNKPMWYHADNVQLEIDGGYEGRRGIYLIEAKVGLKDNINLRQLLYPHLHYEKLFRKLVKTYVLFYEPGTGHFHFFCFRKEDRCFSDYQRYALKTNFSSYCWDDLCAVEKDCNKTDKNVPFPQADSLRKILAAFLKLDQRGPLTKEELFADENIEPRQYDYYANALRWMRLAEKEHSPEGIKCLLTELGSGLAKKPEKEILFEMAKIIFSNDLCHLFLFEDDPEIPEEVVKRNGLNQQSTTFGRRINTIKSWRKYFQNLF